MPTQPKNIPWRGSVSDLATDVCGVLEPEQAKELAKLLLEAPLEKFAVGRRIAVGSRFRWVEDGREVFRAQVTETRDSELVAAGDNGTEWRLSRADVVSPCFELLELPRHA